ncbi:MAG: hypothetical protein KGZ63_12770 [Clostridiales bacterium]|jgi:hypothetical protein|nr:hypothetical protein [Clostridiales bacterium]
MRLKWSIDQLYFYLVCFVMLITIIIGITGLVRAGIDIIVPVPDTTFGKPVREFGPVTGGGDKSQLPAEIIESEIIKQEEYNSQRERNNVFNQAMLQILRGLAQLAVAFPVYLYHWRKIPQLDGA